MARTMYDEVQLPPTKHTPVAPMAAVALACVSAGAAVVVVVVVGGSGGVTVARGDRECENPTDPLCVKLTVRCAFSDWLSDRVGVSIGVRVGRGVNESVAGGVRDDVALRLAEGDSDSVRSAVPTCVRVRVGSCECDAVGVCVATSECVVELVRVRVSGNVMDVMVLVGSSVCVRVLTSVLDPEADLSFVEVAVKDRRAVPVGVRDRVSFHVCVRVSFGVIDDETDRSLVDDSVQVRWIVGVGRCRLCECELDDVCCAVWDLVRFCVCEADPLCDSDADRSAVSTTLRYDPVFPCELNACASACPWA